MYWYVVKVIKEQTRELEEEQHDEEEKLDRDRLLCESYFVQHNLLKWMYYCFLLLSRP